MDMVRRENGSIPYSTIHQMMLMFMDISTLMSLPRTVRFKTIFANLRLF
jgi:hypothetical protein